MATFILVHGASLGGWVWKKVTTRLRDAGHDVFAPTLTGLGDRAHLGHKGINLDSHIADILGVIETEELQNFILVGHSYGGRVITGVAEKSAGRIAALVYLDAFLPKSGDSSFSHMDETQAKKVRKIVEEKGDGWRFPGRTASVFGIRDASDAAWLDRRSIGQPIGCMEQPIIHSGAWQQVKNLTYIHCTENDPSPFGAIAARLSSNPSWACHTLACGHIAMIDMPQELTEILRGVAD